MKVTERLALAVIGILLIGAVPAGAAERTDARVDFRPNPNVTNWLRGRYVYVDSQRRWQSNNAHFYADFCH